MKTVDVRVYVTPKNAKELGKADVKPVFARNLYAVPVDDFDLASLIASTKLLFGGIDPQLNIEIAV